MRAPQAGSRAVLADATRAADREQLLARRLAKSQAAQRSRILGEAETRILRLYHGAAPAGWLCAWCDATVSRVGSTRCAGVGAVILDAHGQGLARISQPITAREPFQAEIAAVEATLSEASRSDHARRIRVYTDCAALVMLWLQRRRDPRLDEVRRLAARLARFELHPVPRRHNGPAHRLAREALARATRSG